MEEDRDEDLCPESKRIKLDSPIDSEGNMSPTRQERDEQQLCPEVTGNGNDEDNVVSTEVQCDKGYTQEREVGITEYASTVSGSRFTGVIKQRYSDFIVNEISSDGQIVRLTSLEPPPDPNQDSKDCLSSLLSSEEMDQLKELSLSKDKSKQVEFKVPDSKEARTQIHVSIRNEFPSLDSRTINGEREDIKLIRVFLKGSAGSRSNWSRQLGGDYVKFVLYKENRDTLQTITTLCSMLKVKPSVFQFGGTKDKRAITSQHVTAYRVTPQRLISINKARIGATLGNFEYVKYQMKLGSIKGNHFTIVIRNVQSKAEVMNESGRGQIDECGRVPMTLEEDISSVMDDLKRIGFINYFGMQRFGTSTIPTHHIGKALLHSNWQEAIDLILKPRNGGLRERELEPADMNAARLHYQDTKDISTTLGMIPRNKQSSVEVILLKGLEKHNANLLAAINCIPKASRMMYCHGYQSYVWNKLASFRVKTYGLVPIPGDIVYKEQNGNETDLDTNPMVEVEFINDSNINKYTIHDVLLPLPGYTVKYPKNDVGRKYTSALNKDGLTSESLLHRVRDFSLPGGYRRLVVKPTDVEWDLMRYNDVTLPLTQSDLDILEGKEPPKSIKDGSKMALKVLFSLPSATYATMALREILRTETSSHFQSQLNQSDQLNQSENECPQDMDECVL